ncbi:MAG TPA: DUF4157 domain-containing protein [Symbiobacteriaceae bacterium]|jgi:hypothetical protein|nr:DUF4157 domain-containing protein [Symbiobacteriaceae bacterium]
MIGVAQPKPAQIHQAARKGVQTASGRLPHADAVQRSFGRHSISGVQAHIGSDAAASAHAMGAAAYATGNHVVFAGQPSLRTVAHEAAHVVQQRGGVQLLGGVGQVGDVYERHADAVADRVVSGRSAEDLLTPFAGGSGGEGVQLQTIIHHRTGQFDYDSGGGMMVSETVGTSMFADLDPNDRKAGSAPGAGVQAGLMQALKGVYPNTRMIRGHLLNGNLGGLGIAENLYPITNQANGQHEREVESQVKEEVRVGNRVRYRVDVVNAANLDTNAGATFRCRVDRHTGGGNFTQILQKDINSHPGAPKNQQGTTGVTALGQGLDGRRQFRNASLHGAWRQNGKGMRNLVVGPAALLGSTSTIQDNTGNTHAHIF